MVATAEDASARQCTSVLGARATVADSMGNGHGVRLGDNAVVHTLGARATVEASSGQGLRVCLCGRDAVPISDSQPAERLASAEDTRLGAGRRLPGGEASRSDATNGETGHQEFRLGLGVLGDASVPEDGIQAAAGTEAAAEAGAVLPAARDSDRDNASYLPGMPMPDGAAPEQGQWRRLLGLQALANVHGHTATLG